MANPDAYAAVAPLFGGEPVPCRLVRRPGHRDFGLTVEVSETRRPFDHDAGADRRWLGVAISWYEVEPANRSRRGLAPILAMGRRLARRRDPRPR